MNAKSPQPASPRLVAAVDALDVQPGDRLLEIGCGQGVAVSLVCNALRDGHILAIDRSATMVDMARRRNAVHIERGRADVQATPLHSADLGARRFDKVFAIRVGLFYRGDARRELEIIARHLAPGGRFHLIYDAPGASPAGLGQAMADRLRSQGWTVDAIVDQPCTTGAIACVIAHPSDQSGAA